MGWWGEEENGVELIIGDGPLDTAHEMLRKIAREYKRDVGRRPTPSELAKTVESAIAAAQNTLFDGLDDMEVSELRLILKKAPRRRKFQAGDYCILSLPSGGYGYIRIKEPLGQKGLLIELLDRYSQEPVRTRELKDAVVMSDILSDWMSIADGEWRVLTSPGPLPAARKRTAEASSREFNKQYSRLGGCCGSGLIPTKLEEKLREWGRLPRQAQRQ